MSNLRISSNSEGVLTCVICLEVYDEEGRRPLLLPACGHTFCKACLTGVLTKDGNKGQLLCPTCRRSQPVRSAEDLPANFSLLELTRVNVPAASSPSAGIKAFSASYEGELCSEHGSRLAFWCTTCEVAACGECLFEGHPRPDHHLARVEDHLSQLQELMNRRSVRIITQLTSIYEENTIKIRNGLVDFVELLRQRRVLNNLIEESRVVRSIAKNQTDLGSLSSVNETLRSLEKEFKNSQIATDIIVSLKDPFVWKASRTAGKGFVMDSSDVKSSETIKLKTPSSDNQTCPPGDIATFPNPLEESPTQDHSKTGNVYSPQRLLKPQPPQGPKPALLARPAIVPKPKILPISVLPVVSHGGQQYKPAKYTDAELGFASKADHNVSHTEKVCVATQTSSPDSSSHLEGVINTENFSKVPDSILPWASTLCGTLSGNWTASKISLEPRGIHVYCLQAIKEKYDATLSLSLISSLMPTESPTVFLDLQEGSRPLGRVYITLHMRLRRAQQFFSLCLGDRGPSYQNSYFHSVLKRGDPGEGLAGGDYDGKAGKGGSAVLSGLEPAKEIAKHCERGLVSRLTTRGETAAQFCITVRDGPRTKTVFPFGRVCQGISVVEEACRRPSLSISVAHCGCVLPLR